MNKPKTNRQLLWLVGIILALVLIAYVVVSKREKEEKNLQEVAQTEQQAATRPLLEPFTIPDSNGTPTEVMPLIASNRITIIDFWASWCAPCMREMPNLVAIYDNYHGQGLGIIGISLDSNADDWQQAVQQQHMTWPQFSELKGWESTVVSTFDVNAIPHTIVVNSQGEILATGLRGEELANVVAKELNS